MSSSFDASAIADTVEEIRAPYPHVAELIERLWAELQLWTIGERMAPVPMTETDRHGPFLGKPEVDVEFFDTTGAICGLTTVGLEMRINDRGILIISETRCGFTAQHLLSVAGYRVWFGSNCVEANITPVRLIAGDSYLLSLNLPIRIGRDIGHNPDDDGPDRPNPPPVPKSKIRTGVE
jgi:hypothetical protein